MNRRTWTLIGLAVAAMGLLLVALAQMEDEANVRFVEDIVERPAAHTAGTFTLLGTPQPRQIPLSGDGGTVLADNARYRNETRTTTAWTQGGTTWHTTHVLRVEEVPGGTRWTHRNETRDPYTGSTLAPATATWDWPGVHAFPVEAFDDGDGHQPRVWAVYGGVSPEPIPAKPSQFKGRLVTTLPDGNPLPPGALVYTVESYVSQCSSKFLPAEERAAKDAAGPNA